jgi:hypothetical protein
VAQKKCDTREEIPRPLAQPLARRHHHLERTVWKPSSSCPARREARKEEMGTMTLQASVLSSLLSSTSHEASDRKIEIEPLITKLELVVPDA